MHRDEASFRTSADARAVDGACLSPAPSLPSPVPEAPSLLWCTRFSDHASPSRTRRSVESRSLRTGLDAAGRARGSSLLECAFAVVVHHVDLREPGSLPARPYDATVAHGAHSHRESSLPDAS